MSEKKPDQPENGKVLAFPNPESDLPPFEGEELKEALRLIDDTDKKILELREELTIVEDANRAPKIEPWKPVPELRKIRILRKLAGRPQKKTPAREVLDRAIEKSVLDVPRENFVGTVKMIEDELQDLLTKRTALEKRLPPDMHTHLVALRKTREEREEILGRRMKKMKEKTAGTAASKLELANEEAIIEREREALKFFLARTSMCRLCPQKSRRKKSRGGKRWGWNCTTFRRSRWVSLFAGEYAKLEMSL